MSRIRDVILEVLGLGLLGAIVYLFVIAPTARVSDTSGMAQKPTLGRIVLYSFTDKAGAIVERPADIVAVWPENTHGVNLFVKLDGTNDLGLVGVTPEDCARRSFWATSIAAADNHATAQAGRWRWPPRE